MKSFSFKTIVAKRNLRHLRRESGIPMNKIAKDLGIRRKHIERIETEKSYGTKIDWDLATSLCDYYGVDLTQLRKLRS